MGDPNPSASADADASSSHCLVCFSDLKTLLRGKTPCGHDDICGICHLRLRHLHKDNQCPICKSDNQTIIVDRDGSDQAAEADADEDAKAEGAADREHIPMCFEDYPMWGDDIGPNYTFRDTVGMFFPTPYYNSDILPLFGYRCHQCDFDPADPSTTQNEMYQDGNNGNNGKNGKGKNNNNNNNNKRKKPKSHLRQLQDHLRQKHGKSMCQLCIDHKRDFVTNLPRMIPRVLQNHMRKGDGVESGFTGHPVCEFCHPKRFYSLQELHTHLQKDHYMCHVCEQQGKPDQYFKNYKSLEKHFDRQHFLCRDVQCLAARFVVFHNEIDLRAHELSVHGGTATGSNKLQLEFKTRRANAPGGLQSADQLEERATDSVHDYNVDGQVFVPEALPSTRGNQTMEDNHESLHPLHVQRTAELREHAARVRGTTEVAVESFPTLSESNAPADNNAAAAANRLRVGWSEGSGVQRIQAHGRPAGRVTETDFPSLGSSSAGGRSRGPSGVVARGSAQHRQFNAITQSASQPPAPQSRPQFAGTSYGHAASMAPSTMQNNARNMFTLSPASAAKPSTANRTKDLAPDNFPSLSGGTPASSRQNGSNQYSAANALAKRLSQQTVSSNNTASAFPALGAPTSKPPATRAAPKPKQAPSINSATNFPAMSPAAPNIAQMARERVMTRGDNSTSQQANVLQAPPMTAHAAKVTLVDMKASLGPAKFKQLKRLTKDFSESSLSPEGYVDQTAALFKAGYADPDFWSYLPNLLESCPNESAAMHALSYMTSLKRQQSNQSVKGAKGAGGKKAKASSWSNRTPSIPASTMKQPPTSGGWGGAAVKKAPPTMTRLQPKQQLTAQRFARAGAVPAAQKKKSAWGGGSTAAVTNNAKAPVSAAKLSVAAATQKPQGGTATKYMANQQKKSGGGKKKSKKKNELRDLAFGK